MLIKQLIALFKFRFSLSLFLPVFNCPNSMLSKYTRNIQHISCNLLASTPCSHLCLCLILRVLTYGLSVCWSFQYHLLFSCGSSFRVLKMASSELNSLISWMLRNYFSKAFDSKFIFFQPLRLLKLLLHYCLALSVVLRLLIIYFPFTRYFCISPRGLEAFSLSFSFNHSSELWLSIDHFVQFSW